MASSPPAPCPASEPFTSLVEEGLLGASPGGRPSLLVVGNTYTEPHNQNKIKELSKWFDVELATCVTDAVSHFGLEVEPEAADDSSPLTIHRLKTRGPVEGGTRFLYRGLRKIFTQRADRPFDMVLCESEPWSFLRWQTWLHTRLFGRGARFAEFTWENVERTGVKGSVLRVVYWLAGLGSDLLVAGNRGAAEICERFGFRRDRIVVLPQLGVDPDHYPPVSPVRKRELRREHGILEDAFLVGFCGRMVESKGVDDLVAAVARLRNEGKDDVRVALMGAGNLEGLLGSDAGADWIHQKGPRPHSEVPAFLQMLDVFVLPSKTSYDHRGCPVWEEQFGHVLIEVMACGVPVLGSRSGAIPEVLAREDLTFPPGDAEFLAQLIARLHDDHAFREEIIAVGHERVRCEFAHPRHAARWADALHAALRQPRVAA